MIGGVLRDRSGSALAEFAALLPIVVLLLLGGVEAARFSLLNQKLDRAAMSIGDLVSQAETLTQGELNSLFSAVPHVVQPFDLSQQGTVLVSAIRLTGATPRINWQRSGAGTLTTVSQIGAAGGTATLPAGLIIHDQDTIIATEVFFDFTTLFLADLFPPVRLYHRSFYRPRLGALDTLG